MKCLLTTFCLFFGIIVHAQSMEDIENKLAFLADVMTNAADEVHRKYAFDQFSELFLEELQKEGSYSEDYERLKFISVKQPEHKAFRIITWYFRGNTISGQYRGVLQTSLGETVLLNDVFNESSDFNEDYKNSNSWFGAAYYNMKHINYGKQDYYLLFGIRYWNEFENIKICEVLSFEDNKAVFGKKIFTNPVKGESYSRLVFRYAKAAYFTLNYNDGLEMVVHDHLIPQMYPGSDASLVPDGSLSGYALKKGLWEYVDEIYNETLDEAPRPKPVLDGARKDLFGRERKQ